MKGIFIGVMVISAVLLVLVAVAHGVPLSTGDISVHVMTGTPSVDLPGANVLIRCDAGADTTLAGVTDSSGVITATVADLSTTYSAASCNDGDGIYIEASKDGYVTTATITTYDVDAPNSYGPLPLAYSHRVEATWTSDSSYVTGATVSIGATPCVPDGNYYYCPVPLASDGVPLDISVEASGYAEFGTSGNRTAATDSQYNDAVAINNTVYGCTDPGANNYNASANVDDGSCTYDVYGCTDPSADNYNASANIDDGSCTYTILGCTDPGANNYDSTATVDDGSCTYDIYGCMDSGADNYNASATVDDGSCTYDITPPTVTTLGDGTGDYSLPLVVSDIPFLHRADLVFSENLSAVGKTAVQTALSDATDATLQFRWPTDALLRVGYVGSSEEDTVTFSEDVMADLEDVAGNVNGGQLLIDVLVPDLSGPQILAIQASRPTEGYLEPQAVVDNPDAAVPNWYYYSGDAIAFRVLTDEPAAIARACVRSLVTGEMMAMCTVEGVPSGFTSGNERVDYVDYNMSGEGWYGFKFTPDVLGLDDWPTVPGGYAMDIYLEDDLGNFTFSTSEVESFGAVFGINPWESEDMSEEGTTNWADIDDFTNVTNLAFVAEDCTDECQALGSLTLAGPLNLTDSETVTALQNLGQYMTVSGELMRIDSEGLVAFDDGAQLIMYVDSPIQPGLVVRDNEGGYLGAVPNNQTDGDPVTIGEDDLDGFVWNDLEQALTFTTTGFSSFETDFTAPVLLGAKFIDGNHVRLTFSEAVIGSERDFSDIRVTGELGTRDVLGVEFNDVESGDTVTVEFSGDEPIPTDTTGTLDINNPPASVTDLVGNELSLTNDYPISDGQGTVEPNDDGEVVLDDLDEDVEIEIPEDEEGDLDVTALWDENELEATLPGISISTENGDEDVFVDFADGTIVSGDAGWDGHIHLPTIEANDSVDSPGDNRMVISLGVDDIELTFSNAVRIHMAGMGGDSVGWERGGVFTEITAECDADLQATVDVQLGEGEDCKITVGDDLIVWTKHFTMFVAFSTGGSSSGGYLLGYGPNASPASVPRLDDLVIHGLREGDVIRATEGDPDVYIVNQWGYKRLFLNPIIFGFYGHLGGWQVVKAVLGVVRDAFPVSGLFTNCNTNDGKVYALEVTGEDVGFLHWVQLTGDEALAQDPDFFKKVFCINNDEYNWYAKSDVPYTKLSDLPKYSR